MTILPYHRDIYVLLSYYDSYQDLFFLHIMCHWADDSRLLLNTSTILFNIHQLEQLQLMSSLDFYFKQYLYNALANFEFIYLHQCLLFMSSLITLYTIISYFLFRNFMECFLASSQLQQSTILFSVIYQLYSNPLFSNLHQSDRQQLRANFCWLRSYNQMSLVLVLGSPPHKTLIKKHTCCDYKDPRL